MAGLKLANDKKLGHVEWIEEKVSGVKDWKKRALGKVFTGLIAGGTVIVPELSLLGRSTLQVLEIMKLAKENNIAVHAVKGNWSLNGSTKTFIAKKYKTSVPNLYNWMKRNDVRVK